MSTPETQSSRRITRRFTYAILLVGLVLVIIAAGGCSAVEDLNRLQSALKPGELPAAPTLEAFVTQTVPTLEALVTQVIPIPAEPGASPETGSIPEVPYPPAQEGAAPAVVTLSPAPEMGYPAPTSPAATVPEAGATVFYANPAAATATALAVAGSPVAPGGGVAAATASPAGVETPAAPAAPALVTRTFTEAQLAQAFTESVSEMGVTATGVKVTLSDNKMRSSAQSLSAGFFSFGEFDVTGTLEVEDGELHFVLEKAPSNFAFTNYIAPRIDTMLAGLVGDLYVTGAEIQPGVLVVTGTERS